MAPFPRIILKFLKIFVFKIKIKLYDMLKSTHSEKSAELSELALYRGYSNLL